MPVTNRLVLAAVTGIIMSVAACGGSSTTPTGGGGNTTPGTLAQHFDTLYQHANASSVGDTNYNFRAVALSDLELAAAFGTAPTNITVTTASGTEQWKGFVFEEVHDSSGVLDSATFVIAYRDSLVHTLILSGFLGNGTSLGSSLLVNDTLQVASSSHSGNAMLSSIGSSCATPIAGLVNPLITRAKSTACTLAQFTASQSLGFPARAGVDAALTSVSFPMTAIAGERFVDAAAGARVGLASLLRHQLEASH